MSQTVALLMRLIRSELSGEKLPAEISEQITPETLERLYTLSKKHDLAHLVGSALQKAALLREDAVSKAFVNALYSAVYRCEKLKYAKEQICALFEAEGIDFLPLKGSVIREYYPEPWMRTSCDIDIYIKAEGLGNAISLLVQKLDYTVRKRESHDVALLTSNGVGLELHFDLIEQSRYPKMAGVLSKVWDSSSLYSDSKHHYVMDDDLFFFYHIAHMAKHIGNGGCGIRPFVDLWLLCRCEGFKNVHDNALLQEGGLAAFADASVRLADVWFSDKKHDETTRLLQKYIIDGGVYGNVSNSVAIKRVKKNGFRRYLLSRLFLPYGTMKAKYPILEKHKWLLPWYEMKRCLKLLSVNTANRTIRELKANQNTTPDDMANMQELLARLELY